MTRMEKYLTIVQYILREEQVPSELFEGLDWDAFYSFAEKQCITGVVFEGIRERTDLGVPIEILAQWIGDVEQIKQQNIKVNWCAVKVSEFFKEHGFRTCILKGQGNSMLYPSPYMRTSGDIDIWVDAPREEITRFVKSFCPQAHDGNLHIQFMMSDLAVIEVHYVPAMLGIGKYNKRLQAFFSQNAGRQFTNVVSLPDGVGEVCVPDTEFNIVQQMTHLMTHFFVEGIGLRQFMDYYYVLKTRNEGGCPDRHWEQVFRDLGILRFAQGVMWIEKVCLGLEDRFLIVEPDEKIGGIILKEILEGGNFGRDDERYRLRKKGYLARGVTDVYRLLKLVPVFPGEVFWRVVGKISNQRWKIRRVLEHG